MKLAEIGLNDAGDLRVPQVLAEAAVLDFTGRSERHTADVEAVEIPHDVGAVHAHRGAFVGGETVVGDVGATQVEIQSVVLEGGVGDEAQIAVAGERALVPLARELFPDQIVAAEKGRPVDRVGDQGAGILSPGERQQ